MHMICLLNDISIMHYVQFGSNISPDYVMPADTPRHVKPYIYLVSHFGLVSIWRLRWKVLKWGGGGGRLTE